jgi:hypothetical protein
MAVELYAGTLDHFNDSMAEAIEEALAILMGPLPPGPPKVVEDRRKLFIAIANGVINHLRDNQAAFEITYKFGAGTDKTTPNILVKDGI